VGEHRVEERVVARHDGEALGPLPQQVQRLGEVAGGVLDADDVRQLGQPQQRVVGEIDAGAVRDVARTFLVALPPTPTVRSTSASISSSSSVGLSPVVPSGKTPLTPLPR